MNINPDEDTNVGNYRKNLKNILKYLKFASDEKIQSTLTSLVKSVILNEDLVEANLIKAFSNIFLNLNENFNDEEKNKKSVNFESIINCLYNEILTNSSNLDFNSSSLFNIYNFMISLPLLTENKIKLIYQNIMIFLVNKSALPKDILQSLLINLNKVILDNLENPLIFSDYLINIYEKSSSDEFDVKILSLSGLFILITKFKLDYSNYYNFLYKTLSLKNYDENGVKTVFDSKYRNRLYKILELSLKSTTVPIMVILSFIKKLARICLTTSANNIAILLGIIQNIIRLHPRSILLLIRNKKINRTVGKLNEKVKEDSKFNWDNLKVSESNKEVKDVEMKGEASNLDEEKLRLRNNTANDELNFYAKFEQFDDEETDTYKTNANMSCLWELYTLKNHFSFKIRTIVNKFEKNFLKLKEFDLNSISNLDEQDLIYEVKEAAHFYVTSSLQKTDYEALNNKIKKIM
jgi:hypothetical protein